MKFDNIQQSRILATILTAIGLWPRTVDSNKSLPAFYTVLLHGPLTFTYISLMWMYFILESNLERKFDVLYIVLTETALVVKILSILRNFKRAKLMVENWQNSSDYELRTDDERTLWNRKQKYFGVISFFYITCSVSVLVSAFVADQFHSERQLVFPFWVPFDWTQSTTLFYMCYIYGFFSMTLTCFSNISLDMMHCYLLLHCALCFELIGMRLKDLRESENAESTQKDMREIVDLHQAVKISSLECEKIVSYPLLAQIILSAFVLCFSIYRIQGIRITEDPGTALTMCQYGVVMTLQIFLPSYYANEITIASQNLTNCLYNSDWYRMSPSNRRFVFLYMEYLKNPVTIRAGNFFAMGLPIFTKTMNNAYSLLALLLNIND